MALRLWLRFIPEPTQHFKPPSINFISAPISKLWGRLADLFCTGGQFIQQLEKQRANLDPTHAPTNAPKVRKEGWEKAAIRQVWLSVFFSSRVHLSFGGRGKMQRGLLGLFIRLCGDFLCFFSCCHSLNRSQFSVSSWSTLLALSSARWFLFSTVYKTSCKAQRDSGPVTVFDGFLLAKLF